MSGVVIDASVAIAWLLDEPRPHWVDELVEHDPGQRHYLVPTHFWLEIGNTLTTAAGLSNAQVLDGVLRLERIGIDVVELQRAVRLRTLLLARETGLTVYDAAYLALAEAQQSPIATLDRQLAAAATPRGLMYSSDIGQISESTASYGAEPDRVSLAAIGRALAEMRERYPLA